MAFREELQVQIYLHKGVEYRELWENTFAHHLSERDKDKLYLDHFLWHLCSWGATDCVTREEAIQQFHQQPKSKCVIFYQFIDEAYIVEDATTLMINDLPHIPFDMQKGDLYVMSIERTWSFMLTHEESCGPYFILR
ncbi:DUF4275 family protein [Lysinibacillus cavernae]|uniref:DUF4275 family protein n=1 Tax=Lysinibacillus cavernae TaxID=2666135 RepID=UPI0012D99CD8|nr:DUF4275 family protein [Lysinibacillus cavernae]